MSSDWLGPLPKGCMLRRSCTAAAALSLLRASIDLPQHLPPPSPPLAPPAACCTLDWVAAELRYPDRHAYCAWHLLPLLYHWFAAHYGLEGLLRVQVRVAGLVSCEPVWTGQRT